MLCREYHVGWICALPEELAAAECMLEEEHSSPSDAPEDNNIYSFGRIGDHNIVLACLPKGVTGTTSAAIVAERMQSGFPHLKFGLMVGIGGGVPSEDNDIRLGDIVVGVPSGTHAGVIQHDLGKTVQDGHFVRTGSLNRPPDVLLNAISKLQATHRRKDPKLWFHLSQMLSQNKRMRQTSSYPGPEHDRLFDAAFEHEKDDKDCTKCLSSLVSRQPRITNDPQVFYGLIASGNQVMKHATTRDRIGKDLNVLCFEMEAAGLVNTFPCLVIRGICDYSDSHKNKTWQPYASATAAAYAKELLCVIPSKGVSHMSPAKELRRQNVTIMPLPRDFNFVGREDTLHQIGHICDSSHGLRRAAIVGLGGVGKTAIAIEYAYRCREADPNLSLFWVHASNTARFLESYTGIAERLKLAGWDDPKTDKLRLVHRWLSSEESGEWLLILDNLDDSALVTRAESHAAGIDKQPFTIPQYLPQNGAIIITSRYKGAALPLVNNDSGFVVGVDVMEGTEAARLLQSRIGTKVAEEEELKGLAGELEYIPLAIAQAGAYITQSEMTSVATYLSDLRTGQDEQSRLLSTIWTDLRRDTDSTSVDSEGDMNAVIRTWQTSFRQIEKQNPLAADLLARMSMFDRQNIPSMILFDGNPDAREYREALDLLLGFSFISKQTNKTSFDMHRLVQLAMKTRLKIHLDYELQREQALATFNKAYPADHRYENWPICATLEPHVDAIISDEDITRSASLDRASLLLKRAYYRMRALGDSSKALTIATEVVSIRPLKNLGDHAAAISVGRQSAEGLQKSLGAEHDETLESQNVLAVAMMVAGRYKDATILQRTSLASSISLHGPEHPKPLTWMYNLVQSLNKQDLLEEAEELCNRVLEARTRLLGSEDPATLDSMGSLAKLVRKRGRLDEAESLNRKVIEMQRRVLGEHHPSTLHHMHNIALVYLKQGRFNDAASILVPLLETKRKIFGPLHPDTLASMHNLCKVFEDPQRLDEAETLMQETLEARRQVMGVDNPSTLSSMFLLARVWWNQKREEKAIDLMAETLTLRERILGADHGKTKKAKSWLEYFLANTTLPHLERLNVTTDNEHDATVHPGNGKKRRAMVALTREQLIED
ncbi:hypothetical protein MBLNU459_g7526t2 [Dothideomycetes sp. NU459]